MGKPQGNRKPTPKNIKDQLKGKKCNHDKKVTQTNRNGQKYLECEQCGAFLGFK